MNPGRHTLIVRPDGVVVAPDLTTELGELLGQPLEPRPGWFGEPVSRRTRRVRVPVAGDLDGLPEPLLWRWHARGLAAFRRGEAGRGRPWLAVKQALARRLLGPGCRLCALRCPVDRRAGGRGRCGLGDELRLASPVRLWGEEEELGRPGLGLMAAGCGLRCRFCYRADLLAADTVDAVDPATVAGWIDDADDVTHVHWLGGNPDESLPGVLACLAATTADRPQVLNTHGYLTPAQTALLEGLVDAVVADLKFGPGDCGATIAGVPRYWEHTTRALAELARRVPRLIVRHVALPGHLDCCAAPAAAWARAHLPGARVRVLGQYEPLWRAADDADLGRRLNEEERDRVANLGDDPPETTPS